jgi:hypothetical protein
MSDPQSRVNPNRRRHYLTSDARLTNDLHRAALVWSLPLNRAVLVKAARFVAICAIVTSISAAFSVSSVPNVRSPRKGRPLWRNLTERNQLCQRDTKNLSTVATRIASTVKTCARCRSKLRAADTQPRITRTSRMEQPISSSPCLVCLPVFFWY